MSGTDSYNDGYDDLSEVLGRMQARCDEAQAQACKRLDLSAHYATKRLELADHYLAAMNDGRYIMALGRINDDKTQERAGERIREIAECTKTALQDFDRLFGRPPERTDHIFSAMLDAPDNLTPGQFRKHVLKLAYPAHKGRGRE